MAPERNDDPPPKKQNERQGTTKKKKKDHACPVSQARTRAPCKLYDKKKCKTHRCRPLPSPRSRPRGPRGGAGRARSRAAARRLPRTPFSCPLVGRGGLRLGEGERAGSLGRGRRGWMRLRMGAWGIECLPACLSAVQVKGRGGRIQYVGGRLLLGTGWWWRRLFGTSYVTYGRGAGGAVVGTTQVLLVAKFTLCCVLVSPVLRV